MIRLARAGFRPLGCCSNSQGSKPRTALVTPKEKKGTVLGAIKSNTAFKRKYDEMRAAGSDDRAARNAVAKKIAATVLAVWKTGKSVRRELLAISF